MVTFYSALSGDTDIARDRPKLTLQPSQVNAALAELGLRHQAYHVFAPGAEFGEAKRWPASHFAQCAMQLNLPVVLLGSGKESDLCAAIAEPVNATRPGQCINLAGKTTLNQALCAIEAAKSVLTNDSGLMHVAAGFGVHQVAVFGSSSPLHTPPLNDHASVIWLKNRPSYQPPLDCAPCFQRVCPFGHTRCLQDISPADVLRFL
jgi:heptosyltransferase-2